MVNNDYTHWEMYAIGGSADPTINSQGNRFLAPDDGSKKEVIIKLSARTRTSTYRVKHAFFLADTYDLMKFVTIDAGDQA